MVSLLFVALALIRLTGASNNKATLVAPGSDVAVRCEDSESGWSPLRDNSIELKLGNTAHLLVQNFDRGKDKGRYRCGSTEIYLEEMLESKSGTTLLYRAEGQSAHLFCKHFRSESCWGRWTWISHDGSGKPHLPRTVDGGQHNNFSHHIASVKWGDSGTFQCQMTCLRTVKIISYELVVVNVTVDPQPLFIRGSVTMCCRVSHWMTPGQVCWVKLYPNINSRRYHGQQERCWHGSQPSFCHQVSDMKPGDTSWACAVFYNDALRALVPVQVNVSKHTTHMMDTGPTTISATGVMVSHSTFLMVVLGLVALLLVTLAALLLCNRRKGVNMCGDEEDEKCVGDEDALWSHSDSVTYTVVYFRRIPAEDLGKGDVSTDHLTDETDVEDMETVVYCMLD